MLASRRRCLHYSKAYCDVTERWLLSWNQNKHIYDIFDRLIPKSVLVFHTFALLHLIYSNLVRDLRFLNFNFVMIS